MVESSAPKTAAALRRNKTKANAAAASNQNQNGSSASTATNLRMYSEDSPGIKVDPVAVLVASLSFIASVFVLHILDGAKRVAELMMC